MPVPKKVSNSLEKAKIKYEVVKHRTVYTAFDKAATLKVPQKIVGKTLVMKVDSQGKSAAPCGIDKKVTLVLIPANKNLDISKLRKAAKAKKISFINESWIKKNLKGIKVGAIPPLGSLWGLSTFVDKLLTNLPKIILNSGDHKFSIKVKGNTLKKLIGDPVIGNFTKAKK